MESAKVIDSRFLLAPIAVAVYLLVALESYLVEATAFKYIFQQ